MQVIEEGLRERKKRETRRRIAVTAMELFRERGFDAVTVAEVARAADVSEKTVFNHFPAKEDLVFARFESRTEVLATAIRERPPGVSIVEPFRSMTLYLLDMVELEPVARTTAMPRLVRESRALQERLHLVWEKEAEQLTPVVATALRADDADLVPEVVTRALTLAHRTVAGAAFRRLLSGEDRSVVANDLRVQADRVYDRLEAGLDTTLG